MADLRQRIVEAVELYNSSRADKLFVCNCSFATIRLQLFFCNCSFATVRFLLTKVQHNTEIYSILQIINIFYNYGLHSLHIQRKQRSNKTLQMWTHKQTHEGRHSHNATASSEVTDLDNCSRVSGYPRAMGQSPVRLSPRDCFTDILMLYVLRVT